MNIRSLSIGILFLVALSGFSKSAPDLYIHSQKAKVLLKQNPTALYVVFNEKTKETDVAQQVRSYNAEIEKFGSSQLNPSEPGVETVQYAILRSTDGKALKIQWGTLEPSVLYESFFFSSIDGKSKTFGISHYFYAKLKNTADVKLLETFAAKHKVQIVKHNPLMPLWYTLACTKNSTGDALTLSNNLHDSGDFAVGEPDIMMDLKIN